MVGGAGRGSSGEPAEIRDMTDADVERFWAKVDADPESCWRWTAATNPRGHGLYFFRGRTFRAHRVAWELLHRPPLTWGDVLEPECGTANCVRPDHHRVTRKNSNLGDRNAARAKRERTHCPKGHEYAGDNVMLVRRRSGRRAGLTERQCRQCWLERRRSST